jgi:hypothetical protein
LLELLAALITSIDIGRHSFSVLHFSTS